MVVYKLLVAIFFVSSLPAAVKGPPQCPQGKVYTNCGTACPQTCHNLGQNTVCKTQCVSGCFCPSGTVQNGDGGCVQPSDCPGQTTVLPNTTSSDFKGVRISSSSTTTLIIPVLQVITNSSTSNTNPQTTIAIIAGSSTAAAAVILLILILTVLLIAIFVRKAYTKLDKIPSYKLKAQIASSGVASTATENLIPVEMNEAYAVTTKENIAYTTAERSDYEEYNYTYI